MGDNESVVNICSINSITLKKNHNYIVYHRVRGYVATIMIGEANIPVEYKPPGLLTNPIGSQQHYFIMIYLLV